MSTAILHTSEGEITIELFPNHAPKTVANFVELATGAKEWVDPNIGRKKPSRLPKQSGKKLGLHFRYNSIFVPTKGKGTGSIWRNVEA